MNTNAPIAIEYRYTLCLYYFFSWHGRLLVLLENLADYLCCLRTSHVTCVTWEHFFNFMVHVLIEKVLDLAFFILLVLLFGILFCLQVTFYYLRICQIIFFLSVTYIVWNIWKILHRSPGRKIEMFQHSGFHWCPKPFYLN